MRIVRDGIISKVVTSGTIQIELQVEEANAVRGVLAEHCSREGCDTIEVFVELNHLLNHHKIQQTKPCQKDLP